MIVSRCVRKGIDVERVGSGGGLCVRNVVLWVGGEWRGKGWRWYY